MMFFKKARVGQDPVDKFLSTRQGRSEFSLEPVVAAWDLTIYY